MLYLILWYEGHLAAAIVELFLIRHDLKYMNISEFIC